MSHAEEDGYATPAAAVMSLAIALVVTAGIARGLSELRQARAELAKMQTEYALDAAQNGAVLAIATSTRPPPYHWTLASVGTAVDVVAEPERPKMSLASLASLDDEALSGLGVTDPASLRAHLASLAGTTGLVWLADQADSMTWRACAPEVASKFGAAETLAPLTYGEPEAGKTPGFWRAGEVWRIQVTNADGWRDERFVRFTGNGLNPAAVLGRRLTRTSKGTRQCALATEAGASA